MVVPIIQTFVTSIAEAQLIGGIHKGELSKARLQILFDRLNVQGESAG